MTDRLAKGFVTKLHWGWMGQPRPSALECATACAGGCALSRQTLVVSWNIWADATQGECIWDTLGTSAPWLARGGCADMLGLTCVRTKLEQSCRYDVK